MIEHNPRKIAGAKAARYFQNTTVLSTRAMLKNIDSCVMRNSPIIRESVRIEQDVWGTSRSYLQGKSTRKRNEPVNISVETITSLPPEIIDNHRDVVLGIDIMFVNGTPFLITVSRTTKFGYATEMSRATMTNVITAPKVVKCKCNTRGFRIIAIAANNDFKALETNPDFIELNISANLSTDNEHEPYIERFNRTIKEKCRMGIVGTLFTKLPRRMIVELAYAIIC